MSKFINIALLIILMLLIASCKEDDTMDCASNINIGVKSFTRTSFSTSVTLKWVETDGFGSNYEYGEKGFVLGTGINGNTTDEELTIENLEKGKQYDFYIQSNCAHGDGQWSINPYPLSIPLNCPLLSPNDIGLTVDVENLGLNIYWNSTPDFIAWEVELVKTGEAIGSGTRLTSSTTGVKIPNVTIPQEYDLYIRGKCFGEENFGEWVKKPLGILSGHGLDKSYYCGDATISIFSWEDLTLGVNFNSGFGFTDSDNIDFEIEFVEEGMELGTGLRMFTTSSSYYIRHFENDFDYMVKPNTKYNIYARTICYNNIYGEWTYLSDVISAYCNEVYFEEEFEINEQYLAIFWSNQFGFNQETFAPYGNYSFQIEFGVQGFDLGTGTVININEQYTRSYDIPIEELQSGLTYEFFIRTKCNDLGYGKWNYEEDGTGLNFGRLVIDIP